jgi:STE24 endopeptidase
MSAPGPRDPADARARRYHRRQFALGLLDLLLGAVTLAAWTATGATAWLAGALAASLPRLAVVAVVVMAVGGSAALVTVPLDVLAGYVLPRRAGLLTQSFRSWLGDRVKTTAIGGALALAVALVVYALLGWSPRWWWLVAAALLGAASVLLTAIVPVWVIPLFYQLTRLEDPGLRARLLALAARAGVAAADVLVADFSRKGPTANAAVVGLGRTRRILVSDTLLGAFAPDEIEVVLAHELAHHARGHMAQGVVVQVLLVLATLWAADGALRAGAAPLGLAGPADPAGIPFLMLVASALGLLATPLLAAWSRRLEREADRVALEVTRAPAAFVAAMERLGALNLAERRPGRLRELLFATHPSLDERVALARSMPLPSAPRL